MCDRLYLICFAFAVLIKDMMSIDAFELLCKKFWWALILIGFLASLVHNHEKQYIRERCVIMICKLK